MVFGFGRHAGERARSIVLGGSSRAEPSMGLLQRSRPAGRMRMARILGAVRSLCRVMRTMAAVIPTRVQLPEGKCRVSEGLRKEAEHDFLR